MDKRIIGQFEKKSGKSRRKQYVAPTGVLKVFFDDAKRTKCIQATEANSFDAIMVATRYNPCDGCAEWAHNGPECKCFQEYHSAFRAAKAALASAVQKQKDLHTRVVTRCACGLRIRGTVAGHEAGQQHLRRVKGNKR